MGRQKARRLSPCLPPVIDDGMGDNDSRGDPLKEDGRYPDMAGSGRYSRPCHG